LEGVDGVPEVVVAVVGGEDDLCPDAFEDSVG